MGTTRQARKQYAITPEGVEFVESRLQGGGGDAGDAGEE
jgi:DNA-binding PadR family transcriptional regulator